MFWLNWVLALAVLIVYPLAVFPIVKIGKKSRSLSNFMQEHIGKTSHLLLRILLASDL